MFFTQFFFQKISTLIIFIRNIKVFAVNSALKHFFYLFLKKIQQMSLFYRKFYIFCVNIFVDNSRYLSMPQAGFGMVYIFHKYGILGHEKNVF